MSYESCKPPFSTPNLTETGPNFFFGVKNRFFFRRKRNGFCPRGGEPHSLAGNQSPAGSRPEGAPQSGDSPVRRRRPFSRAKR